MTPPPIIENKTKNSEDVNGAVTRDMMQKVTLVSMQRRLGWRSGYVCGVKRLRVGELFMTRL